MILITDQFALVHFMSTIVWAKTERPRRVIRNADGTPSLSYLRNVHMFGRTALDQHECYVNECNAYYTFIYPGDIKRQVNMTPLFHKDTLEYNGDWMETVTLI